MAGEGEPRIETGHHYVMAIEWQGPKCDPGDGELPGRARAAAASPDDPRYSLRDEFTGRTAEELGERLDSTAPGQPEQQEQQAAAPGARTAECG